MALPIIPMPPFPNVPAYGGVPLLTRIALGEPKPLSQILAGLRASNALSRPLLAQQSAVWGVYNATGTKLVLTPDNIYTFSYRKESNISDYPLQGGSFETYNKVRLPFETALRFTKGGSFADREQFINQIEAIADDTNLYLIVTPEKSYPSVNVLRVEITRRSSEGAFYLAEVDVVFREIRQQNATYSQTAVNTSNAQNPAAVPAVNQGLVQTIPAPGAAVAAAASALQAAPL